MNTRTRSSQHGIALIELVLTLPLLLLLMLGVAEMGRALYQYNSLVKAVRDGIRYLSSNAFTVNGQTLDPDAVQQMENLIRYGNPQGQGKALWDNPPTIETRTQTDGTGTYITIKASYRFAFVAGNPLPRLLQWGTLPNTLPLTVSQTMRAQ